jgi:putative transposase
MVTGATLYKDHFFKTEQHLDLLETSLFDLATKYQWRLEAWAIFPNHYHFIAQSPYDPSTLRKLITHFHAHTARHLNSLENTPGRKIWYQYIGIHN